MHCHYTIQQDASRAHHPMARIVAALRKFTHSAFQACSASMPFLPPLAMLQAAFG